MARKIFDMAANTHRKKLPVIEPIPFEPQWGTSVLTLYNIEEEQERINARYRAALENNGDFTCQ